ncbi:MAG: peptidoglycan -binding protein, partial [Alphaproteobacteria bacterium]
MSPLSRRSRQTLDIWPGFVDALATLLMVIIFLLSIFIV